MSITEQPRLDSTREAKARAKAEKAYARARRPWYKKKRFMTPLALGVLLTIAVGATSEDGTSGPSGAANRPDTSTGLQAAPDHGADRVAPEADEQPVEEPAEPPVEEPVLSAGQENALRSAEDYLSLSGFSRSGLIEQLKFEGYTEADAAFAADAVGADWNEQAARSAEEYLDVSGFSRSGLIDQLMFEGYTRSQAEHGVTQAGL